MADVSVTASSVAPGSGAQFNKDWLAGETITAGQTVYLTAASGGNWMKAQNDDTTTVAGLYGFGIALHGSLSGQPIVVQIGGLLTAGGTLVAGNYYCISATLGGICPIADVIADTTSYMTFLGYATTTGILQMNQKLYTGIAVA